MAASLKVKLNVCWVQFSEKNGNKMKTKPCTLHIGGLRSFSFSFCYTNLFFFKDVFIRYTCHELLFAFISTLYVQPPIFFFFFWLLWAWNTTDSSFFFAKSTWEEEKYRKKRKGKKKRIKRENESWITFTRIVTLVKLMLLTIQL